MAFVDKSGIGVASGFKLQAMSPLDARSTVSVKEDLTELVNLNAAYKGLLSYNDEDGITYKYGKDGNWFAVDLGEDINEVLSKYLPLSGGVLLSEVAIGFGNNNISIGSESMSINIYDENDEASGSSTGLGLKISGPKIHILSESDIVLEAKKVNIVSDIYANKFIGSLSGNADTASKWANPINLNIGNAVLELDGSKDLDITLEEMGISPNTGSTDLGQVGSDVLLGTEESATSSITNRYGETVNKITITNENTSGNGEQPVYIFQTSDNSGVSYTDLLNIYKDGSVKANTFIGALEGNATSANKLTSAHTISISGAITATPTAFDGSKDITIPVTSIDGSKITGIIPLACIPKGAQERLVTVNSIEEMYNLTTEDIQLGDIVRVINDGNGNTIMQYVADEGNLANENGYLPFYAGMASSVPVTGVDGLEAWANERYLRIGGVSDGDATITVNVDNLAFNDDMNIASSNVSIVSDSEGMRINNLNGVNTRAFEINNFESIVSNATSIDFASANLIVKSLEGNATSASFLQTARNITLSGAVSSTAVAFDGSEDITIPVSAVSASALYVPEGDVLILDGNAA